MGRRLTCGTPTARPSRTAQGIIHSSSTARIMWEPPATPVRRILTPACHTIITSRIKAVSRLERSPALRVRGAAMVATVLLRTRCLQGHHLCTRLLTLPMVAACTRAADCLPVIRYVLVILFSSAVLDIPHALLLRIILPARCRSTAPLLTNLGEGCPTLVGRHRVRTGTVLLLCKRLPSPWHTCTTATTTDTPTLAGPRRRRHRTASTRLYRPRPTIRPTRPLQRRRA